MFAGEGRLWHPFAVMSELDKEELVLERGEGCWVYATDGRRFLDATAALWYCNVGHGRQVLADTAAEQMRQLACYQIFGRVANRPALELAERVCSIAPVQGDGAAFFVSGGSDAIDTAGKIARRYWAVAGKPERRIVISREGAYHGVNAYGTSLSGIEANASGWGPLVREVLVVPRHSLGALEEALIQHSGEVAAFIGELVQGAAGVYPPEPGYWQGVQELCAEHDVLLIADEVISGFGRLGKWFGSERYEVTPDIVSGAKGLSSGYLPIGVVIVGDRIRDVLWSSEAGMFRHGYTYSGHPAACAVALENLAIIEREGLVERVAELEPTFESELGSLASHPLVGEVRTAGLLCGVELDEAARGADAGLVEHVMAAALSRGVLVRNLVGRTLQISPPFVITTEEIGTLVSVLRESLDEVAERLGRDVAVEKG
jgi:putrescine aminotransferase